MKKGLLISLLLCISLSAFAQSYPPEWVQYTSGGYLADIQSDRNTRNVSDTEFKNYLLNLARTNLAKQVRMHIEEAAVMKKSDVDGHSSIVYSSETNFSTELDLQLVETKTQYDSQTGEYHAIAFIDKKAAGRYYQNEIAVFLSKTDNSLTIARNYIDSGFKDRAKTELEALLPTFGTITESFFWLGIFDVPQNEITKLSSQCNTQEQTVKKVLADLQYGTSICLVCSAEMFGTRYPALQNELKGILAQDGCNFTENPKQSDWIIRINASSRKYNDVNMNGQPFYFTYADAEITIDKTITSQRIYEDGLSVKGGHSLNHTAAARVAYKNLEKQLGSIILKTIKQ